jgi:hypothetical protein
VIALKQEMKRNGKEMKSTRNDAEIAFKHLTDEGSLMENYLKKIVAENNKNDRTIFDNLAKNQNVKKRKIDLKHIKKTVFDRQIVHYLNAVCSDSGECLAFGRETVEIQKIFDNFTDFRHLKKVSNAGSESANGFVLNLHYETMNYRACALLKSSKTKISDNLYYEYLVGTKFINKVNQIFPCFTETYHLFKHRSVTSKNDLLKNEIEVSEYSKRLKLNDCDTSLIKDSFECLDRSCKDGVSFSILVQYISEPISVTSFLMNHANDKLFDGQLICILYQIYVCLSYIKNHFTHYDLHSGNVLLYKLPEGKFMNIKYIDERSGKCTTIKTNYIAKIIDYGRCYFGNLGNKELMTSKTIGDAVFKSSVCSKLGPSNVGFDNFEPATKENYYISSIVKNISHDLRLAYIASKLSVKMGKFFDDRIVFDTNYGTSEKESNGSGYLHNVTDMSDFLENAIHKRESVSPLDEPVGTIEVRMTKQLCEKKMVFVTV